MENFVMRPVMLCAIANTVDRPGDSWRGHCELLQFPLCNDMKYEKEEGNRLHARL